MGWLDFIFPKRCFGCRRIGTYICADCLNKLAVIPAHICPMCGKGSIFGETHGRCQKKLGIDGLIAAFLYRGVAKTIVTKYKYNFIDEAVSDVGELLCSFAPLYPLTNGVDVVVGVPLHPRRYRWRGFNQADELGKRVAVYLHKPFEEHILERVRYTIPQMTLSGQKRRENLMGAFSVEQRAVKGKCLLVVDDVWTTGSTLSECAKALKQAGAKRVVGLVFARA
jgi:competence protein ComFC